MAEFKLHISEDDDEVAYLELPAHPGLGKHNVVKKSIRLYQLIENYKGTDLHFDFDETGQLIGIEILL